MYLKSIKTMNNIVETVADEFLQLFQLLLQLFIHCLALQNQSLVEGDIVYGASFNLKNNRDAHIDIMWWNL